MNFQFNSIHSPNYKSNAFLRCIDSSCSDFNHKYNTINILPPKANFINFNDFGNYEEQFYKRKNVLEINHYIDKWTDLIVENIFPRYEKFNWSINTRNKLIFDIKLINERNELFQKYKNQNAHFYEYSNFDQQVCSKTGILTYIEPTLIEDQSNISILQKRNHEKTIGQENHILEFDLKNEEIDFFTNYELISSYNLNEEIIAPKNYDLDFITSCTFIQDDTNHHISNQSLEKKNSFIDSVIQANSYFDRFLQSMKVMILKFDCKNTMNFEPFTQEWFMDLQISEKDFNEKIIDKSNLNSIINQPTAKYDIWTESNKIKFTAKGNISEEYSPILFKSQRKIDGFIDSERTDKRAKIIQEEHFEKEIPSTKIPTIVHLNTLLFSEDDIKIFENIFKNLKFVGANLCETLILTIDVKIANIFLINNDFDSIVPIISKLCSAYNQVIITTIMKPQIFLSEKVKWRQITSHSQIVTAIIPYLIEENLISRSNKLDDF